MNSKKNYQERIQEFISRRFPEDTGTWTNGNCYWLSFILKEAFGCKIYYLPIMGHFVAKDKFGTFYDQTGIIELEEEPIAWEDLKREDELWYSNIVRDCVL